VSTMSWEVSKPTFVWGPVGSLGVEEEGKWKGVKVVGAL
jgi:hypothetical protein